MSLKHENIFLRRKRYLNTLKEDLKKIKLENTGVLLEIVQVVVTILLKYRVV